MFGKIKKIVMGIIKGDKKKKLLLLQYLKSTLANEQITKSNALQIRIKVYEKSGDLEWVAKMKKAIISMDNKGDSLSTALVKVGIFTKNEKEKFDIPNTMVEGIDNVMKNDGVEFKTPVYWFAVLGLNTFLALTLYLTQPIIKDQMHTMFVSAEKAAKQSHKDFKYLALYEDNSFFEKQLAVFVFLNILFFLVFFGTKKYNNKMFFKLFRYKRDEYTLMVLKSIIYNNTINLTKLVSYKKLKEGTVDSILKEIYEKMYDMTARPTEDRKLSTLLEEYSFDTQAMAMISGGEDGHNDEWEFIKIAKNNIQISSEEKDKFLDKFMKNFRFYSMYVVLGYPFGALGIWMMFDLTASMM